MGGISKQRMRLLCNRLAGEISLTPRGEYRVETRHPIIADALSQILFDPPTSLIDRMDIFEAIVIAAGRFSRAEVSPSERKLLTTFPLALSRTRQTEDARHLFEVATHADPLDVHTWQAWALLERDANNFGDIDTPGTARFLFNKGVEADPGSGPTWQAWALLEKDANNFGEIDTPGTARFLFNKGVEADPGSGHIWQAWAVLEWDANNFGNINTPGTARFLFNKGVEADPGHGPTWQAWALLERDANNFGDIDTPGTARFLFNKGVEADPGHGPIWQAWAQLELAAGELVEASSLLERGLLNCARAPELLRLRERLNHEDQVSTSAIQQLIEAGDLSGATTHLGRSLAVNPTNPALLHLASELSRMMSK